MVIRLGLGTTTTIDEVSPLCYARSFQTEPKGPVLFCIQLLVSGLVGHFKRHWQSLATPFWKLATLK